jgi:hypothetical protein
MFKLQVVAALTIAVISVSPLQEPIPPASPFAVPDGPLPWALPLMPNTTFTLVAPDLTLDPISHSGGFSAIVADIEDRAALVEGPMSDIIADLDALAGPGGTLPDLSGGGAADTTLDPNATGSMTISDFQDNLTSDIVTVFSYARIAQSIGMAFLVHFFIILFISLAWQMLVRFILFAIQLFDGAVALFDKLKQLILFFLP